MSPQQPENEKRPGEHPGPHDEVRRSGEGANTALEAMIRQRKLAEGPDPTEPAPPAPPNG